MHVERRRQAEGRFLSPVLRGIFEYLVLPLDVVGIELQLVVVAAGRDVVRRLVQIDKLVNLGNLPAEAVVHVEGHIHVIPQTEVHRLVEAEWENDVILLHHRVASLRAGVYLRAELRQA